MLKSVLFLIGLFISACVTVNIYFPAAAVERAADQIVKETWGGVGEPAKFAPKPQSYNRIAPARFALMRLASFVGTAHAQEADINVSNPAIRALKDAIRERSSAIKPFMDRGNIGIAQDGMLVIRTADGLNLKERADTKQLVDAENRDRENLYAEIAKANNISRESIPKIKAIFAKSWQEQAQPGWWLQNAQGAWRQK
jgi:uncharacterized protein YdbL (DUF1318 family)